MGAWASRGGNAPIVFLDVDGVLNTEDTRCRIGGDLDRELIGHLLHIVRSTKAAIVLSTTWRLTPGLEQRVRRALVTQGIPDPIGATPDLSLTGDRVDEILQWLADNAEAEAARARSRPRSRSRAQAPGQAQAQAGAAFVAIDDLALTQMNSRLSEHHFVRTSDAEGLTLAKADEAIRKLQAQLAAGGGTS